MGRTGRGNGCRRSRNGCFFSPLFCAEKYYVLCAACGAIGWLVYFCFHWDGLSPAESTFVSAAAVIFLSRLFAVWERCPATLFMIPGIFPIVPGAGIYWTAHYIVTDQLALASRTGFEAVKAAAAIVLGIIFVFEIPQRFLGGLQRERSSYDRNMLRKL